MCSKMFVVLGLVSAGFVTGCAPDPKTMSGDYIEDAKYNTAECKEMR